MLPKLIKYVAPVGVCGPERPYSEILALSESITALEIRGLDERRSGRDDVGSPVPVFLSTGHLPNSIPPPEP